MYAPYALTNATQDTAASQLTARLRQALFSAFAGVSTGLLAAVAVSNVDVSLASVAAPAGVAVGGVVVSLVNRTGFRGEQPAEETVTFPTLAQVREQMAAEINRARRYERPLSLLSFSIETTSPAEAADVIMDLGLRDTDIWAIDTRAQRVLVLAPETTRFSAHLFGRRISNGLAENGIVASYGAVSFPDDGLSLDTMIEQVNRVGEPAVPARAGTRSANSDLSHAA